MWQIRQGWRLVSVVWGCGDDRDCVVGVTDYRDGGGGSKRHRNNGSGSSSSGMVVPLKSLPHAADTSPHSACIFFPHCARGGHPHHRDKLVNGRMTCPRTSGLRKWPMRCSLRPWRSRANAPICLVSLTCNLVLVLLVTVTAVGNLLQTASQFGVRNIGKATAGGADGTV